MMRLIDADALMKCIPSEEYGSRFAVVSAPTIDLSDYSDRLWRKAYEQGKADAESDRVSPGNIVINEQGWLKYCPMCGSRMRGEDYGETD